jgi:hypothetical protein
VTDATSPFTDGWPSAPRRDAGRCRAATSFVTLGFRWWRAASLTPLFGSGIYTWATASIVVGGLMADISSAASS